MNRTEITNNPHEDCNILYIIFSNKYCILLSYSIHHSVVNTVIYIYF